MSLALDSLSSTATLANATGNTACAAPAGNPFINVGVGGDGVFSPGEEALVQLQFSNPTNQRITYNTRVLAGGGGR